MTPYKKACKENINNTESMIRVNHAGEYGAARIYEGQLFVLGADETISHMLSQEKQHLDAFQNLLVSRRIRPSFLQPLWHVGGFLMGAATAAMGRNFAHACTSAVETVIDEHYTDQLKILSKTNDLEPKDSRSQDDELFDLIQSCHADECAHKDTANRETGLNLAESYPIFTRVIEGITKTAIEIAKRI